MKKITSLLFFFIVASVAFAKEGPGDPAVSVISTMNDVFYFKIDKEFVGASVEVYNAKDELIIAKVIPDRRSIIDFYYQDPGKYTIKIKKGEKEEKFVYMKATESPFIEIAPEAIDKSILITNR